MPETDTSTSTAMYECHNTSCPLGSKSDHGLFTGEVTQEQAVNRWGDDAPYGVGICPNCGKAGKLTSEKFEALVGKDPNQPVHDLVDSLVQDEEHPLTPDLAQDVLVHAITTLDDNDNQITKPETAVDHALSAVGL